MKRTKHLRVDLLRVYTGIEVSTSDGRVWFTDRGYTTEKDIRRQYPGQWADLEHPGDRAHIIDYRGLFARQTRARRRR